jgi:hypothetical protein
MIDLDELKRLLAGTPMPCVLQENDEGIWIDDVDGEPIGGDLLVAAVNALPDLIAEIERLREQGYAMEITLRKNTDEYLADRERIERLEAALRFYGDENNWERPLRATGRKQNDAVFEDRGDTARAALKPEK